MGYASTELAGVQVELFWIAAEQTSHLGDHLGVQSLDAATAHLVERVAYVQQLVAQALGLLVRHVDQPGCDQSPQDHAVAQPTP